MRSGTGTPVYSDTPRGMRDTTTRREVLCQWRARGEQGGPQPLPRQLDYSEVDTMRRLDCLHYDKCLNEAACVGCAGWRCPLKCTAYELAPAEDLPYRADEPAGNAPSRAWGSGAGGGD